MGLFNRLGRNFEEFKQEASAIADENAEFECAACGERLFTEHETCPECGSAEIVRLHEPTDVETSESEAASTGVDDAAASSTTEAADDTSSDTSSADSEGRSRSDE